MSARDGHKGITLGPKGETIKAVGQAAREELKAFLGREVHLFLTVKVRPGWLDERERYGEIGLDFPEGEGVSAPRLTAEFWVQAYLARLRLADIPAFVTARGDATAGAVAVKLNTLDGAAAAFTRAWDGSGRRVWTPLVEGPEAEVDAALGAAAAVRPGPLGGRGRGPRRAEPARRAGARRVGPRRDGLARRGHPDRGAAARRELGDRRGLHRRARAACRRGARRCRAADGAGAAAGGAARGRMVGAARGASRALSASIRSAARTAAIMADRAALAALASVTALIAAALPERDAHPALYARTVDLVGGARGRGGLAGALCGLGAGAAGGARLRARPRGPARSAGRPRGWSGCRRRAGGR